MNSSSARRPRADSLLTETQVTGWVEAYVRAWSSGLAKDIKPLFAPRAEYHEWPYETHWIGRDEIVAGWQSREDWQSGGWDFEWSVLMITGDTAAISGIGSYRELGRFANLWTVTFSPPGRCTVFRMWNNQLPD